MQKLTWEPPLAKVDLGPPCPSTTTGVGEQSDSSLTYKPANPSARIVACLGWVGSAVLYWAGCEGRAVLGWVGGAGLRAVLGWVGGAGLFWAGWEVQGKECTAGKGACVGKTRNLEGSRTGPQIGRAHV